MSILSAIKESRHESNNLDDLAKLPQTLIMSMAQRGEIKPDMVMPILGRKAEMADEKAKMQAAQQLAAQGGALPTVMENYMGKIAQAENPAPMAPPMPQQMAQAPMAQGPEDVGIASQATAPMQMAGGGIIAFDNGGDVDLEDDDYQEAIDNARRDADYAEMYDLIDSLQGGASENRGVGIKVGRDTERGAEGGDLESRLRAVIMGKESGGKRYDKNGNLLTSSKGAQGEMQVMPGTAKDPGFGIKAARSDHPDELRRVGDEYASMLLNRYQDPKLAMIAYNMGPSATDKWLAKGADISKLPKETQGYIRNVALAQGGEIRHFAAGDYIPFGEEAPYDPESSWGLKEWWKRNTPGSKEYIKAQEAEKKKAAPAKSATPAPTVPSSQNAPRVEIPQSPEGIKNLQEKADEENFNLMQYIKGREAKMDAAEKKDLAMAGLAAGLGMLGGTSQYAFENIGKGGQMGVQQLASSQKNRMAQEAAMGKLYGEASRLEAAGKYRTDALKEKQREFDDRQSQSLLTAKNNFIQKRLKERGMDEMMLGTLKRQQAMGKLDPSKLQELQYYEKQMRDIENEANRMYSSPGSGSGFSARRIG